MAIGRVGCAVRVVAERQAVEIEVRRRARARGKVVGTEAINTAGVAERAAVTIGRTIHQGHQGDGVSIRAGQCKRHAHTFAGQRNACVHTTHARAVSQLIMLGATISNYFKPGIGIRIATGAQGDARRTDTGHHAVIQIHLHRLADGQAVGRNPRGIRRSRGVGVKRPSPTGSVDVAVVVGISGVVQSRTGDKYAVGIGRAQTQAIRPTTVPTRTALTPLIAGGRRTGRRGVRERGAAARTSGRIRRLAARSDGRGNIDRQRCRRAVLRTGAVGDHAIITAS